MIATGSTFHANISFSFLESTAPFRTLKCDGSVHSVPNSWISVDSQFQINDLRVLLLYELLYKVGSQKIVKYQWNRLVSMIWHEHWAPRWCPDRFFERLQRSCLLQRRFYHLQWVLEQPNIVSRLPFTVDSVISVPNLSFSDDLLRGQPGGRSFPYSHRLKSFCFTCSWWRWSTIVGWSCESSSISISSFECNNWEQRASTKFLWLLYVHLAFSVINTELDFHSK